MTFSIPIDIKRCILEGIEPPDDAVIFTSGNGLRSHISRRVALALLSSQSRVIISECSLAWLPIDSRSLFDLSALPKFPLLMPDDDFAAAINEYAAKWGKE